MPCPRTHLPTRWILRCEYAHMLPQDSFEVSARRPIAQSCLGISDGRADDRRLSGRVPSHRGSVIASVTQFKKIAPTVMRSNHTDASSVCSHVSARDHPSPAVFVRGLFPNGAAETESQSAVDACGPAIGGAQGQAHAHRRTHRNTPCKQARARTKRQVTRTRAMMAESGDSSLKRLTRQQVAILGH